MATIHIHSGLHLISQAKCLICKMNYRDKGNKNDSWFINYLPIDNGDIETHFGHDFITTNFYIRFIREQQLQHN